MSPPEKINSCSIRSAGAREPFEEKVDHFGRLVVCTQWPAPAIFTSSACLKYASTPTVVRIGEELSLPLTEASDMRCVTTAARGLRATADRARGREKGSNFQL